ncbi:hypothetical protein AN214_01245 [Pseudoalteromonas sp. P1-9]|nr:hypothetical protein AN214_01245 [Pseudoalteromonas sp. P1-9]
MKSLKKVNWLWFVLSLFFIPWLSIDIFTALTEGKIMQLRVSDYLYFETDTVMFSLIFLLKLAFLLGFFWYFLSNLKLLSLKK